MMRTTHLFLCLTALLICCAHAEYVQKNVYYEADCSGSPSTTIIYPNICTFDSNTNQYVKANCTSSGISILQCTDNECTNCTASERDACYPEEGFSSRYFCIASVPEPPAGSYVEERYNTPNCAGDPVYYLAVASGFCQSSGNKSVIRTCDTATTLNVTTCDGSGCTTNCATQPQNTGCVPAGDGTVLITCTNGTAPVTTGSTTTGTTTSTSALSTTTTTASATTASATTASATTASATTASATTASATTASATTASATTSTTNPVTTTSSSTTGGSGTTTSTTGSTTTTAKATTTTTTTTSKATTSVSTGATTSTANIIIGNSMCVVVLATLVLYFVAL